MGVFFNRKKEKNYKSNIAVGQLNFENNMDRNAAVIMMDKGVDIDGAINICLTQKSLEEALDELKQKHKNAKFTIIEAPAGMMLDNVIQKDYKALIIHGLADRVFTVTKEDLMPMKDFVDSFCIMYAAVRNKITNEKAYELMANKNVYILGNMLTSSMKTGDTFGVVTIKRQRQDGIQYESIKAFLTEKNAKKYNAKNDPINAYNIKELCRFWQGEFGIIIEPHVNYWIEFNVPKMK